MVRAPQWSENLGFDCVFPLRDELKLRISSNTQIVSKFVTFPAAGQSIVVDAAQAAGFSLGLRGTFVGTLKVQWSESPTTGFQDGTSGRDNSFGRNVRPVLEPRPRIDVLTVPAVCAMQYVDLPQRSVLDRLELLVCRLVDEHIVVRRCEVVTVADVFAAYDPRE